MAGYAVQGVEQIFWRQARRKWTLACALYSNLEPPIAVPTEKARISTQVYFMHSILVRVLYTSQWDSEPKLQRRFTERWHVARN